MFFFFNDTATTEFSPLTLHDALPISGSRIDIRLATRIFNHLLSLPLFFFEASTSGVLSKHMQQTETVREFLSGRVLMTDRKSTRLNSSHQIISYAVFCLKKKKTNPKH